MDSRTLRVLEFDKIRERMARHASFSLGRERVLALLPTDDIREAQGWQAETREARTLLEEKSDVHLGGVHDLRSLVEQAVPVRPCCPWICWIFAVPWCGRARCIGF